MIDCYSLVIAKDTSEDKLNGAFSAYFLVERAFTETLGDDAPFHILSYWKNDGEPLELTFRIRFALGDSSFFAQELQYEAPAGISRVRVVGFPTPPDPGTYEISMEWKLPGKQDWVQTSARWLCLFEKVAS